MPLPTFIVIGAAKSGTTSLWSYLGEHPEIFMTERKELDFFCEPDWRERMDWYEHQFEGAGEVRGEASVYYSMDPFKLGVAAAIAETVPDAKLIYVVRDPVPRAVAHYVQNVATGYDDRPIDEAFADFDAPANEYVCSSRYASQLRAYLEHFDRERIFVGDQHRLLTDREGFLRDVFAFLGVDEDFRSEQFESMANTRQGLLHGPTALGWRLRSSGPGRLLRRLPPGVSRPLRGAARRIFDRKVERWPELDRDLAERVTEHLRPEAAELREMTGLSLETWSILRDGATA